MSSDTQAALVAGVHVRFARWVMIYLFGVYGLVVIAVFLPVLLLYVVAGICWLALTASRALLTHLKHICAAVPDFLSKQHWDMIRH
jgi:hypothetical protein